jgi:PAS domain-containing protein
MTTFGCTVPFRYTACSRVSGCACAQRNVDVPSRRRRRLVGYASVASIGWGVIVERFTAVALAQVRAACELAFGVLLAFIGAAVIVSIVSTRWLTQPLAVLAVLAEGVQRHAAADYAAPLPRSRSRLSEIAQLASAFRLVRENVLRRTTERDQASMELRESEARLRQLMDGVPVGIFVVDTHGTPYYANLCQRSG